LGDPTAKNLGRLSLNPVRHLDQMATAMILLVGFGWGKPVPVNPYYLRGRSAISLVAGAGPTANVIAAALFAIPVRAGLVPWHSPFDFRGLQDMGPLDLVGVLVGFVVFINIILAVFNLIPLAPLDGSKVALGVAPRSMADTLLRWEASGPIILLAIIGIDWLTGLGLLWGVLLPVADMVGFVLLGHSL
jgi:Zn-dependent protease